MTCKNLEGQITQYLEEALAPLARADFEAHLAACSDCRKRLDEMRALIGASHDLGGKLNQEWRARAGETQDLFMEKLQDRALKESSAAKKSYRKLAAAAAAVASRTWHMVVLDEVHVAISLKLLTASRVLSVLRHAPKDKIIICTGRGAPDRFVQIADLVTEMKEIKHPFQKGIKAQKGFDY